MVFLSFSLAGGWREYHAYPFWVNSLAQLCAVILVINEEQSEVVRNMFTWLVDEGLSSYAIARRLWETGLWPFLKAG
jgi:hypothetical protein